MTSSLNERYEILKELGKGGMGRVVLARDRELDRYVAIKTLHGRAKENVQARFIEEAQITGQLSHPNIVSVHELGIIGQTPFLAMTVVKGQDFKKLIKSLSDSHSSLAEEFPLRRLLRLFLKACQAIAFAHEQGILHRDIKPANIMLGEDNQDDVLVMDWGLALPLGQGTGAQAQAASAVKRSQVISDVRAHKTEQSADMTQQGSLVGTPAFMAPEQADNPSGIDERSDVYGLGATLYSIVCHQAPYQGTQYQVISQLFKGPPRRPSAVQPELQIPAPVESIILKAMARKLDERYQSVQELIADIERYLDGQSVIAHNEGFKEMSLRLARNHSTVIITAIVSVLVLLCAFAAGLVYSKNQQRQAQATVFRQTVRTQREQLRAWKAKRVEPVIKIEAETSESLQKILNEVRAFRLNRDLDKLIQVYKSNRQRILALQEVIERAFSQSFPYIYERAPEPDAELAGIQEVVTELKDGPFKDSLLKDIDSEPLRDLEKQLQRSFLKAWLQELKAETLLESKRARRILDQSFAQMMLGRDPKLLLDPWLERLDLGPLKPVIKIRCYYRLRDWEQAYQLASEYTKKSDNARVQAMARVFETRLRRNPKAALLKEQLDAIAAAFAMEEQSPSADNELDAFDIFNPAWLYMHRAECLTQQNKMEAAKADFQRAGSLDRVDAWIAYSNLTNSITPGAHGTQFGSFYSRFFEPIRDLTRHQSNQKALFEDALLLEKLHNQSDPRIPFGNTHTVNEWIGNKAYRLEMRLRYAALICLRAGYVRNARVFSQQLLSKDPNDVFALGVKAESLLLNDYQDYEVKNSQEPVPGFTATVNGRLKPEREAWVKKLKEAKSKEEKAKCAEQVERLSIEIKNTQDRIEKFTLFMKRVEHCPKLTRHQANRQADELVSKHLQRYPEDARLNYVKGVLLRQESQIAEALPFLRRGVRGTFNARRYYELALACLKHRSKESLEEGVKAIRRALSLTTFRYYDYYSVRTWFPPREPALNELYGDLREAQNMPMRALLHYQRGAINALFQPNYLKEKRLSDHCRLIYKCASLHHRLGLELEAQRQLQGIAAIDNEYGRRAKRTLIQGW